MRGLMATSARSGDTPGRRRPSARRIRAARAYSGLERPAFARETGITPERLNYLENGKGPPSAIEEAAIRSASGVPRAFLRHGFDEPEIGSDIDQLDRLVSQQSDELRELRDQMDRLRAELLGRVLEVTTQLADTQTPTAPSQSRPRP